MSERKRLWIEEFNTPWIALGGLVDMKRSSRSDLATFKGDPCLVDRRSRVSDTRDELSPAERQSVAYAMRSILTILLLLLIRTEPDEPQHRRSHATNDKAALGGSSKIRGSASSKILNLSWAAITGLDFGRDFTNHMISQNDRITCSALLIAGG